MISCFIINSSIIGGFVLIQGSLIVYSILKCSNGFRMHATDDVVGSEHADRSSSNSW